MLQSIASVVQAVQPVEEIPSVEVGLFSCWKGFVEREPPNKQTIVNPIVQKLFEVLQVSSSVSEFFVFQIQTSYYPCTHLALRRRAFVGRRY